MKRSVETNNNQSASVKCTDIKIQINDCDEGNMKVNIEQLADATMDDLGLEKIRLENKLQDLNNKSKESYQRRLNIAREQYDVSLIRDAANERINSLTHETMLLKEKYDSMIAETQYTEEKLKSLMQINVLNDSFYIWYSGPYATINNFRLGSIGSTSATLNHESSSPSHQSQTPSSSSPSSTISTQQQQLEQPIDWNEVNAALGQAALAIDIVAQLIKYSFKKYDVHPMGSYSTIIPIQHTATVYGGHDKSTHLNLYTDGSVSFSLFPKRNFNTALTGFVTCIEELGAYVCTHDPTLTLPYVIDVKAGKISDVSFLLSHTSTSSSSGSHIEDEAWTRAMKYLLTDIKWILAWTAKHLS